MEANTFELKGGNFNITYSAQGDAGRPVLTYHGPGGTKIFPTAEIEVVSAKIGQLVTVTLLQGVDEGTEMLSLLVPTVMVEGAPININTHAVFCKFNGVIGSGIPRQVQAYRVEPVSGSASFVPVRTAAGTT